MPHFSPKLSESRREQRCCGGSFCKAMPGFLIRYLVIRGGCGDDERTVDTLPRANLSAPGHARPIRWSSVVGRPHLPRCSGSLTVQAYRTRPVGERTSHRLVLRRTSAIADFLADDAGHDDRCAAGIGGIHTLAVAGPVCEAV